MYQVKSQLASEEIQLKLILAPKFAFILLPPFPCPVNFERFKQWPHRLEGGSLNVTNFDVIHSQDPSLVVTLKHVQFPCFAGTSKDLRGPTSLTLPKPSGSVGLLLRHIKNSNSEQKTNAGLHFYCLIPQNLFTILSLHDGQHLDRSQSCKNEGNKLV